MAKRNEAAAIAPPAGDQAGADQAPSGDQPPAPGGLEDLAGQASAAMAPEGEPGTQLQPVPAAPPGPTNAEVVSGLLATVRETVCEIARIESPRRTLTDDTCAKLGAIWGACLDHYGINLADKMGRHGPLLAAVIGTVPLLMPVVIEARREISAKDAARPVEVQARPADQAPAPAAQPGAFAPREDGVIRQTWQ